MILLLKKMSDDYTKNTKLLSSYLQCNDDFITIIDVPISCYNEINNYIEHSLGGSIVEQEF